MEGHSNVRDKGAILNVTYCLWSPNVSPTPRKLNAQESAELETSCKMENSGYIAQGLVERDSWSSRPYMSTKQRPLLPHAFWAKHLNLYHCPKSVIS